ncbi:MAG: UDP-2,3-diacylglucosamine hydrolase [Campylobacterota bacterium]|nr:UDP-2,3-diacylglucosamine hydrolase [Campylobacterota bacterium]
MFRNLEIKEGAFVVADAHYSHKRPELLDFLKAIYSGEFKPTQLFFMGDIFDALFGEVPYTHNENKEAIEILNALSKEMEIFYFEGNHDFNLSKIFPNIKIFPINSQPARFLYGSKKILLAHGDIENRLLYRAYTALIRNRYFLHFLATIDFLLKHTILKKLDAYLSQKKDCKEFIGFESFIANRLALKYECDYFVEGHFHQNKMVLLQKYRYFNLGAFACNQRYFVVKSLQETEFLEENIFSKGN